MTKVKKLLKKAFTLVELVVVVAIIAILSGVSVAAYVGITDRANKASDQETVAQLNHQLAAEEAVNGKNGTCFDAIKDCYSTGLNLEELRPSTKNSQFVWDQDNDRFAIINEDLEVVAEDSTLKLTSNQNHRWVLSSTYTLNAKKNPIYLLEGCPLTDLAVTTGIDIGINTGIKSITFTAPAEAPEGDIVIRTNLVDMTLTVDADNSVLESTNILHYGICGAVNAVKTTSTNKYIEKGTVLDLSIDKGNAKVDAGATAYNVRRNTRDSHPTLEAELRASIFDIYGNDDKNFADSFNVATYKEYTLETVYSINSTCAHTDYEFIIDNSTVYCVCKGCGACLVVLSDVTYYNHSRFGTSEDFESYSPYQEYWKHKITPYGIVTSTTERLKTIGQYIIPNPSYPALTSNPTLLQPEQRYCSHENIEYSLDSTNPNYFHIGTCKDCGYSFKDIHDGTLECNKCSEELHVWNDSHICTKHGADHCLHYTYTAGSQNIEISMCNGTVAIWGFNDAEKSYLNTELKLSTVLTSLMTYNNYRSYYKFLNGARVVFNNSTYIPKSFCYQGGSLTLTDVYLADTVTHIGSGAFERATYLRNVRMSPNVVEIGSSAFSYTNIRSIIIPEGVSVINSNTFEGCNSLMSVYLNDSLTKIDKKAFEQCSLLRSLTLPASLTTINNNIFSFHLLKQLNFKGTVAQWNAINWEDWEKKPTSNKYFTEAPAGFRVQCSDGTVLVASADA